MIRFHTCTQSPTAYISGRLVFIDLSTTMVPRFISIPVPSKNPVFGRIPAAIITSPQAIVPAVVLIASTLSSPRISSALVPVITRIPFFKDAFFHMSPFLNQKYWVKSERQNQSQSLQCLFAVNSLPSPIQ